MRNRVFDRWLAAQAPRGSRRLDGSGGEAETDGGRSLTVS